MIPLFNRRFRILSKVFPPELSLHALVSLWGSSGVTSVNEFQLNRHHKPTRIFWCFAQPQKWGFDDPCGDRAGEFHVQGILMIPGTQVSAQTVELIPCSPPFQTISALSSFQGHSGNTGGKILLELLPFKVFPPKTNNSNHGPADRKGKKSQIKEKELFCAGDVTRKGGSACAQTLPEYFQFSFIDFTSLPVNIKASWAVSQHK